MENHTITASDRFALVSQSMPTNDLLGRASSLPPSSVSTPKNDFGRSIMMTPSTIRKKHLSVRWDPKLPEQDPNRKKLKEKDHRVKKATSQQLNDEVASPPPPDAEEEWRQGSMFVRAEKKVEYEPDFPLFEEQKKLKGFLFFGKNKDAEKRLSQRALKLKPNMEIAEDKLDEMVIKMIDPVQGLKIGKRKAMFAGSADNCFTGEDLVKFISKEMNCDVAKATFLGQTLFMNHELIVTLSKKHTSFHCKPDVFYRFKVQEPKSGEGINKIKSYFGFVKDEPVDLSEKLLRMGLKVLEEFKKGSEGIIDFRSAKLSPSGLRFLFGLSALQKADLIQIREDEKRIPFLLNIFHCFMIANFLLFGVPLHTSQRREAICRSIDIDGHAFSGEALLKILFNERIAGTMPSRYVKLLSISEKDPLRMFSVYDGADYCVPICIYNSKNYEALIKSNAKNFVEKAVVVNSEKNEIILPRLFKDHLDDFGGENTEVVKFVSQLTDKFGAIAKMVSTANIRFGDATYEGVYRCKIPFNTADLKENGKVEIK